MLFDKTKTYLLDCKTVKNIEMVCDILREGGYLFINKDVFTDSCYYSGAVIAINRCGSITHNPNSESIEKGIWIDVNKLIERHHVERETITIGDNVYDKEEFENATKHLKEIK